MGVLRIYPQHTTKQEGVQVENANQQEQVGPSDAQCRYHLHQGPGRGERGIHQYPEPEQQRWIREAANPRPDRPRPGRRPGGHYPGRRVAHDANEGYPGQVPGLLLWASKRGTAVSAQKMPAVPVSFWQETHGKQRYPRGSRQQKSLDSPTIFVKEMQQ